ncbi:hypothetical protein BC941DRAFT_380083 [Chlamydoabsidia padenii]|nr:hypothetical protein BC941DRAFT_380083 [Chlamydoabsidia padenii]
MGLLSNDRLAFGPLKPIVLRGSPGEDTSYVFTSHATLSLSKPEKVSCISVSLVSTSFVYFPEGIGARAAKTTFENPIGKQTLMLLKEKTILPAGVHTFPFTFIIPNSLVDTIEDEYGRVRHMVELQVGRSSKASILNPWRLSKPVLVLRSFLSNSLLLNHAVQDLSHTFERHLTFADATIMVDVAAFSPGDLFTILFTIQPHQKYVRLESIEATVTESRRYAVPSLGAWRTTSNTFDLQYLAATPLIDSSLSPSSTLVANMGSIFNNTNSKQDNLGLDLTDTYAYRIIFATPTCRNNIHHTTHFKDILFRHRLDIQLTLSYLDDNEESQVHKTFNTTTLVNGSSNNNNNNNNNKAIMEFGYDISQHDTTEATGSSVPTPSTATTSQAWQNVLLKLKKGKQGGNNTNRSDNERRYEKISITTPIHVFDCRLKEDYGSLPSYFETGPVKPRFTTIMPTVSLPPSPPGSNKKERNGKEFNQQVKEPQHHAYLCECYMDFCQLMEMGHSSSLQGDHVMTTLERIPSKPPPDYCLD